METTNSTQPNLTEYIKIPSKWRFVPGMKKVGVPCPGSSIIDGTPVRSTTRTFYIEFYENGRRVQRPVGTSYG